MANYTAVASRLKVKKDAPSEVFAFLDSVYAINNAPRVTAPPIPNAANFYLRAIGQLESMLQSSSAYFETYEWRVKEEFDDYIQYESRASCKHADEMIFMMLCSGLYQHLVVSPGDIVMRSVSEGMGREWLIYYDGTVGFDGFTRREGFGYDHDYGCVTDCRHPGMMKYSEEVNALKAQGVFNPLTRRRLSPDYELPWTVAELDKQIAEEKANKDANWHPWG